MDHPRVARLMDVYEAEGRLSLVMECMEGGELFERVMARNAARFAWSFGPFPSLFHHVSWI